MEIAWLDQLLREQNPSVQLPGSAVEVPILTNHRWRQRFAHVWASQSDLDERKRSKSIAPSSRIDQSGTLSVPRKIVTDVLAISPRCAELKTANRCASHEFSLCLSYSPIRCRLHPRAPLTRSASRAGESSVSGEHKELGNVRRRG